VHEMMTQNIPQHLFLQTGKEGNLGHIRDTELVRIAAFYEFLMKMIDSSLSLVVHMGHTVKLFTLSPKKRHKWWFLRNMSSKKKPWENV
jgi:hypothetical protein